MKRSVFLISIKDPHVVRFTDGGVDREGQPTSQRQALMRVLSKRVNVDGRELPIFRLAKEPTPWVLAPTERLPESEEFQAFDDEKLYEYADGERKLRGPFPAWTKARDAFLAKSIERQREAEAQVETAILGDVGKGISQLVKAAAGNMPKGKQ